MKKKIGIALILVLFAFSVFAAKPVEVIDWSNGFPSGEHFNLNIHGKKDGYTCDPTPGGNSVFVPEYGDSEIQIIQNKKSRLSELYVHDPCSFSTNDPAKVQLPSGEYQVYARILAKPTNDNKDEPDRTVVFYPKLIDACNDNSTAPIDGFGDYIDCSNESLVGLGVVTKDGAFTKDMQSLTRTNGKSKAVGITDMFTWSGFACDAVFDIDNDGEITVNDTGDYNGDNVTDELDVDAYVLANCESYEDEWIFNIADLVVYGWDYKNTGSKLLQVRFYPKETTVFE